MKKFAKLFALFLLPTLFLASCGGESGGETVDYNKNVTSVTLDVVGQTNMQIGDTLTVTPIITYKDDQEVPVNKLWKSSRPNVATINNGMVAAVGIGKATISYIAGYKMAYFDVVVSSGEEPVNPDIFSLTVIPTETSLEVGESFMLRVTVNHPELVEDPSYTLSSDDTNVATVTQEGLVRGIGEGTAHIVASSNGTSATCTVTVTPVEEEYDCTIYFFIDYNNIDENDETGAKLVKKFDWYADRPLGESGQVPNNPTTALDPAFPYFVGWSAHPIIDTLDDLWDMEHDVLGSAHYIYLFGIWSDVEIGA